MTQLIFVEGLPGAGKTTTAMWLAEQLQLCGMDAEGWKELDDPHPLHSFWTWDDGYTDPLKIEAPFDADIFSQRVVARCRSAVSHLLSTGQIYVIEAYPFQLVIRIHLKMGATAEQIQNFYEAFQGTLSLVRPLLVFLNAPDTKQLLKRTCAERGQTFEERLIGSVARSPYGRQNNLAGWPGLIRFYTEYGNLVRTLLPKWQFSLRSYLPLSQGWDLVKKDILCNLGLAFP